MLDQPSYATWDEECSQYTPGARWVPGGEYYVVPVGCWLPGSLEEGTDEADAWMADHAGLDDATIRHHARQPQYVAYWRSTSAPCTQEDAHHAME